jgi:hypothetical protein
MLRPIKSFHRDEDGHWVARLACGHNQHVRHAPPLTSRTWLADEDGRASRIGHPLECKKCDEGAPPDAEPGESTD